MSTPTSTPTPPSRLSALAVDSADVVLDERKMYAVEWRDGATFGFTVTPVNSDRGTVLLLARRTARREQLEAAGLHEVVPGDLLVAIGDEKVYHLGADHAATFLRSVKKPVRLTLQLSPYGNQAKQLPDLAPNEYHYLWEDGPLGIVLTLDPKSKLPMVKRLSDKANDVVRRDVSVSDQLIYANDVPTSEYSMDEVMSILREMPKPVLLRFRKQLQDDHLVELPALAENEYEFLWDYGPLGLVIGMSRSGLPFVRSFTGLGTSRQLSLVQEDDEIVMVNDKSARDEGFRETMQYLMNVPKPAVLRFRRKVRSSTATAASASASDDGVRASHAALRASSVATNAARPSTPGYQQPAMPDCVGPLSPVAPLGASMQNFALHDAPPPPPLSPQVRVSLDRSRFRSVSSERRISAPNDLAFAQTMTAAAAAPAVMNTPLRASSSSVLQSTTVAAGGRPTQTMQPPPPRFSDGERFVDVRSSPGSRADSLSGAEDRETAILPPDPQAISRSSIFTFNFEDAPPIPAPSVERPRRISAKSGSMPPDAVVEPMMQRDELSRSQSSRPITDNTPTFVPLPEPVKERNSVVAAAGVSARTSSPAQEPAAIEKSSRASKPARDTAEQVAEPVVAKVPSQRGSKFNYVDTADLAADHVATQQKSPVDNQREVETRAGASSQSEKSSPSPSKNQVEDTAELAADPVAKPTKKSYVDTADLVAESAKAPKPKQKQPYIDTAELFAEPAALKKAAPATKQYEDTADLVADPSPARNAKKEYVDTADLVAVPPGAAAAAPPAKAKKEYIDTAELFAEPPAPKPAQLAAPVAATPAPAAAKTKPVPAAPLKTVSSGDATEYFTVDPAAFYTVQWTDGPFGSTVREADSTTGPVMLITKRTGKQTCAGLRRIAVGDILVRIGDKDVSSLGFEKATRYLRKVPKPVPLTFQAID